VVVIDGGGTITQMTFQTLGIKRGQRVFIDAGLCAMGSGLPQGIGASFAKNKGRVICLCGDGSFQFNIQELQTIVHHDLPVKIFIINNNGYLSIRHTQGGFLDGRFIGSGTEGGLSVPDIPRVARAYGLKVFRAACHRELKENILKTLAGPGPCLCEILVDPRQEVIPRQGFDQRPDGSFAARPLEDMYPFLDRREFLENMIVGKDQTS
jgi:acetolactate synthase-1/2/3 large subunit